MKHLKREMKVVDFIKLNQDMAQSKKYMSDVLVSDGMAMHKEHSGI